MTVFNVCANSRASDLTTRGSLALVISCISLRMNWLCCLCMSCMYYFRRPWFHFDFLYNFTKDAKEFKKHCDFVHSVADDVIQKRKQTLVRFFSFHKLHVSLLKYCSVVNEKTFSNWERVWLNGFVPKRRSRRSEINMHSEVQLGLIYLPLHFICWNKHIYLAWWAAIVWWNLRDFSFLVLMKNFAS